MRSRGQKSEGEGQGGRVLQRVVEPASKLQQQLCAGDGTKTEQRLDGQGQGWPAPPNNSAVNTPPERGSTGGRALGEAPRDWKRDWKRLTAGGPSRTGERRRWQLAR